MKRGSLFCLIILLSLINFVSASDVGLIENNIWQWNLTGLNNHNGAVLGDIDNDGDLDLISIGADSGTTVSTDPGKSYVYTNNGTTFTENSTWQQNLSEIGSGSIALGDVDNDGDLDLILSGRWPNHITRIYINNGTTFIENSLWQNPAIIDNVGSQSIALGDVDNDGDLDLIFSSGFGYSSQAIYINNGTSFVNNSIWSQGISEVSKTSTGLVDFDSDGDLDLSIIGTDTIDGGISYINNGTSLIRDDDWYTTFRDEANVAWGDVDNDGDLLMRMLWMKLKGEKFL